MLTRQCHGLLAMLGVLFLHLVAGDHGPCLDGGWCQDMATEADLMECLRACRDSLSLSDETPIYPGHGHMKPLSDDLQKYVLSHFPWDKLGKSGEDGDSTAMVLPASSQTQETWDGDLVGDSSLERDDGKRSYAMEHFRWGKPVGRKRRPVKVFPNGAEEASTETYPQEFRRDLSWESPEGHSEEPDETKKDGYKMNHFRWGAPAPKRKRYGGFMTSERSRMPLVTLFKNAIVKTPYKKGQ
ncbi:pro-opiomelanocortin [Anolis carolinensis]|uniref:Uncharacterized protein n=1 Tax=Anolis carolinensis TaxID=28377 RepID=H9GHK1_ANOCA|nr:PREDICTED: pro-opiomelanocortin [Anolis carolinensis]|eukprot:XP_003227954.1 PREDICTED: pro-opiomelanocortin [Anolis carolinensis]